MGEGVSKGMGLSSVLLTSYGDIRKREHGPRRDQQDHCGWHNSGIALSCSELLWIETTWKKSRCRRHGRPRSNWHDVRFLISV
jgi:hypothetical protein